MSIRVNNESQFLHLLKEAVLVNTVRPRPEEEEKISTSKYIRCSPEIEGDSQLAAVLFVGVANQYGISQSQIIEYFGMELDEYREKLEKFKNNHLEALLFTKKNKVNWLVPDAELPPKVFYLVKLANKVKLINSFIKLNSKRYDVLIRRSSAA